MSAKPSYIHLLDDWPSFTWDQQTVQHALESKSNGTEALSANDKVSKQAVLEVIQTDIVSSFSIEGISLNEADLRHCLGDRLGIDTNSPHHSLNYPRRVAGIVDWYLGLWFEKDIVLTEDRLFGWHNVLFQHTRHPASLQVAKWRITSMQVVNAEDSRTTVHFEAPRAEQVPVEMKRLFEWLDTKNENHPYLNIALTHLWFLTIHPFGDGNGRLARAITDWQLNSEFQELQRPFSLSKKLLTNRKEYYERLSSAQSGEMDVTKWIIWFVNQIRSAKID